METPTTKTSTQLVDQNAKTLATSGGGNVSNSQPAIRMVVQRYRRAKLLVDESRIVTVGVACPSGLLLDPNKGPPPQSAGLLAYISFAKTATKAKVEQAAKTLLNLPVLTLGAWGDGSGAKSMYQLSKEKIQESEKYGEASLSILVVPQANITAKVKKLGKSIQYRDQIAKAEGKALYEHFVERMESLLVEHRSVCRGEAKPNQKKQSKSAGDSGALDPSIPPSEIFHPLLNPETGELTAPPLYGSYEEPDGVFPLTLANGEPLTKSARKKLQKIYDAHSKRHAKYLEKGGVPKSCLTPLPPSKKDLPVEEAETMEETKVEGDTNSERRLDASFVELVPGSFGKRQGLELESDMGPFCHVFELE